MTHDDWLTLERIHYVGFETTKRGKPRHSRWDSNRGISHWLADTAADGAMLLYTISREVYREVAIGLKR